MQDEDSEFPVNRVEAIKKKKRFIVPRCQTENIYILLLYNVIFSRQLNNHNVQDKLDNLSK